MSMSRWFRTFESEDSEEALENTIRILINLTIIDENKKIIASNDNIIIAVLNLLANHPKPQIKQVAAWEVANIATNGDVVVY